MFKKLTVSVLLVFSLFSSLTLWAKNNQPSVVAKIEVENQLSISAHEAGQSKFINQIDASHKSTTKDKALTEVPMSVISVFWTMVFALLIFVVRVTARRIK